MNDLTSQIKILPSTPQDARGITEVLYKTWLDTYPNKDLGITREDIEDSYKNRFSEEAIKRSQERIANLPKDHKQVVAKYGDLIVAVSTMIRGEEFNKLKTIYVLPEFQGKGIGNMLWNEVKKFCDPAKDIIVQVATYNQNAINFYKKLGFVDTGKRWLDEKFKFKSGATLPEMEMIIKMGSLK